jgi:hypothetical protein
MIPQFYKRNFESTNFIPQMKMKKKVTQDPPDPQSPGFVGYSDDNNTFEQPREKNMDPSFFWNILLKKTAEYPETAYFIKFFKRNYVKASFEWLKLMKSIFRFLKKDIAHVERFLEKVKSCAAILSCKESSSNSLKELCEGIMKLNLSCHDEIESERKIEMHAHWILKYEFDFFTAFHRMGKYFESTSQKIDVCRLRGLMVEKLVVEFKLKYVNHNLPLIPSHIHQISLTNLLKENLLNWLVSLKCEDTMNIQIYTKENRPDLLSEKNGRRRLEEPILFKKRKVELTLPRNKITQQAVQISSNQDYPQYQTGENQSDLTYSLSTEIPQNVDQELMACSTLNASFTMIQSRQVQIEKDLEAMNKKNQEYSQAVAENKKIIDGLKARIHLIGHQQQQVRPEQM